MVSKYYLFGIFFVVIASFGFAANCTDYTNFTSCEANSCEWELNQTSWNYSCYNYTISNYCDDSSDHAASCIVDSGPEEWPYFCYWIPEEENCMPTDGDCSSYDNATCENYAGCAVQDIYGGCYYNFSGTPDNFEDDDNLSSAKWYNGTEWRSFDDEYDEDWIKFNATAGKIYVIQTHNLTYDADTYMFLLNSSGTVIDSNDDVVLFSNVSSRIVFEAEQNETYYLNVTDFFYGTNWSISGDYMLTITTLPEIDLSTPAYEVLQNGSIMITANVTCNSDCNLSIYLDPKVDPMEKNPKILKKSKKESQVNEIENTVNVNGETRVVVKFKKPESEGKVSKGKVKKMQDEFSEKIKKFKGVKLKKKSKFTSDVVVSVNKEGLEELLADPVIESVIIDKKVSAFLDESIPQINADDVWTLQENGDNLTGANQVVCVIDTGINYSHSDFGSCSTSDFLAGNCSKVLDGYDFVNDDNDPYDDNGHGTHVAGIVAGNDSTYKGVAYESKLLIAKVLNSAASGFMSDVRDAIYWCNNSEHNVSVITLSLGAGNYTSNCDDQISSVAINDVVADGQTVVVASGNSGNATALTSPACASSAISVGRVNVEDQIASSSQASSFLSLLAPGSSIMSTDYEGTHLSLSGTSMAAPHVAGAAAILNQYYNLHLGEGNYRDAILNDLQDYGIPIHDSRNGLNFSRIDLLRSVENAAYKGVIPTSYADPFYTTSNNPQNISLSAGESVILNWTVIATGDLNKYNFFAFTEQAEEEVRSNDFNINITEDIVPPNINFLSPLNGTILNGTIVVQANATDNEGISSVSFYINGTLIGTDLSSPYSFYHPSILYGDGIINMTLETIDVSMNSNSTIIEIIVNNTFDVTINVSGNYSAGNGSVYRDNLTGPASLIVYSITGLNSSNFTVSKNNSASITNVNLIGGVEIIASTNSTSNISIIIPELLLNRSNLISPYTNLTFYVNHGSGFVEITNSGYLENISIENVTYERFWFITDDFSTFTWGVEEEEASASGVSSGSGGSSSSFSAASSVLRVTEEGKNYFFQKDTSVQILIRDTYSTFNISDYNESHAKITFLGETYFLPEEGWLKVDIEEDRIYDYYLKYKEDMSSIASVFLQIINETYVIPTNPPRSAVPIPKVEEPESEININKVSQEFDDEQITKGIKNNFQIPWIKWFTISGGITVTLLLGFLVYLIVKRKRKKRSEETNLRHPQEPIILENKDVYEEAREKLSSGEEIPKKVNEVPELTPKENTKVEIKPPDKPINIEPREVPSLRHSQSKKKSSTTKSSKKKTVKKRASPKKQRRKISESKSSTKKSAKKAKKRKK